MCPEFYGRFARRYTDSLRDSLPQNVVAHAAAVGRPKKDGPGEERIAIPARVLRLVLRFNCFVEAAKSCGVFSGAASQSARASVLAKVAAV